MPSGAQAAAHNSFKHVALLHLILQLPPNGPLAVMRGSEGMAASGFTCCNRKVILLHFTQNSFVGYVRKLISDDAVSGSDRKAGCMCVC